MTRFPKLVLTGLCLTIASAAHAGPDDFHKGSVFEFGPIATIDADVPLSKRSKFKLSFDTSKPSEEGKINRTLESAARFINMHVEAGVPQKNIDIAVVVHGKASFDLVNKADNANVSAIKALTEEGVRIILCGQSAAYYDVKKEDLVPGVEMAISAMTAHALLQKKGYALNPF